MNSKKSTECTTKESTTEYRPSTLGPDVTIPFAIFGGFIGIAFTTVYPLLAKEILIGSISLFWFIGVMITLTLDAKYMARRSR